MKTFHSSGTASGKVERMWRWKMTIPATAIVPIDAALGEQQDQRQGELDHRAHVGAESRRSARAAGPPGGRGRAAASPPASGSTGVLLIITVTTKGKWRFSFEDGRPPPDADEDQLRGDDHVRQREQEDDQQVAVDLRPGGQERDLVAQPEQRRAGPAGRRPRPGRGGRRRRRSASMPSESSR